MNNMMKALAFALLTSASVPGAVYAQQGVALFGKIRWGYTDLSRWTTTDKF
jgi:iron complex outermembrane recepter protein